MSAGLYLTCASNYSASETIHRIEATARVPSITRAGVAGSRAALNGGRWVSGRLLRCGWMNSQFGRRNRPVRQRVPACALGLR